MTTLEIKFDPKLDYQLTAIESTLNIFQGQPKNNNNLTFLKTGDPFAVIPNKLDLTDTELLENLNKVREKNQLPPDKELVKITHSIENQTGTHTVTYPNFSIEMETGTDYLKLVPLP